MKFDINNSFKNVKVKYGSYATIITVVGLAVLIVLNLVIGSLNLKFDITQDKRFSLSETSIEILSKLDKDVNIYTLFETGNENPTFTEMIRQYETNSSRIKLENKDPYLYPQFMNKYAPADGAIDSGSVIVECGNKFKVIGNSELVTYEFDYQTYQQYPVSIDLEPKITSAISYVTSDNTPIAYVLTGHNEIEMDDTYKGLISNENYELKELNLVALTAVPEDCSALFILAPSKDLSPEEVERIKAYQEKGGDAIVVAALSNTKLPNFEGLMNSSGISLNGNFVIEGNSANALQGNPLYLLPTIQQHSITQPIIDKRYPILLPFAQGINVMDVKKRSITVEPLLTTSKEAYGKVNLEAETIEKETGDADGPFDLAVAITDTMYEGNNKIESKMIVVSSYTIIDPQVDASTSGTNASFFINSLNWLIDKEESTYIPPKSLQGTALNINGQQQLMIMLFSCIILPLAIFITGFVVWLRRKNR